MATPLCYHPKTKFILAYLIYENKNSISSSISSSTIFRFQRHKDEARYHAFTKEKLAQQILGQEMDKIDAEKSLEDRATTRTVLRDKRARSQAFVKQWHEQGLVEWRINQDVARRRELEEETYRQRELRIKLYL